MSYTRLAAIAVVMTIMASATAFSQMSRTPDNVRVAGGMLTDAQGMTLYTFDKDTTPGKSACSDKCSDNWPALAAGSEPTPMGNWSVVTRDDGVKQWAYKGKPLYTFIQDKKPGDMGGEGKGGVWHMAMP
jgi:predicted lipoprotein with Yx(FWY)xxD motif